MAGIFDTILQSFKSAQKNTQRYLSLGFVFTLLCFFYVVEPFFLYTSQQRSAVNQQKETLAELDSLGLKLEEIRFVNGQTQRSMAGIRERVRAYPDHLNREVLPQIYNHFYGSGPGIQQANYTVQQVQQVQQQIPQQLQQQFPQGGQSRWISIPGHITVFSDAVNWYVRNWFQAIVDDLNSGIADPILKLDLFESGDESRELDSLTRQAVESVNAHLETIDPAFWHTYQEGKVETVGELQRVIDRSFEPVTVRLDEMHQDISTRLDIIHAKRAELKADSAAIRQNLSLINDRIKSVSSPFGPIPLHATELSALFPVLLFLIVLFTAISMGKSAGLYADLWNQYRADGKKGVREFLLITDCWYLPPYRSFIQPVLLILFTIIITIIFIYSSFLVWSEPALFSSPGIGDGSFRRSVFISAYIIGLMVIVLSVFYVYKMFSSIPDIHEQSQSPMKSKRLN